MTPSTPVFHLESQAEPAGTKIKVEHAIGFRPFYLDFLANAVNHLLLVRSNAEYAVQNGVNASSVGARDSVTKDRNVNQAPRLFDVAKTSILQGNLAKLALTCDDKTWGVDWIAPSFTIKGALLRASTSARSQVVLAARGGKIDVRATGFFDLKQSNGNEWTPFDWTLQFESTFKATCEKDDDRSHDSEHLLLNYLQHLIDCGEIKQQNDTPGFLSLVSERIPCSSCTKNIREFLTLNSWISLRLFYFYDTSSRGAKEFLAECGKQQISRLDKIALESVVHLISVEGDAMVHLSEAAQEKQKMFGGAPNQIVSMVKPSRP